VRCAGIEPREIDLISGHLTATKADPAEIGNCAAALELPISLWRLEATGYEAKASSQRKARSREVGPAINLRLGAVRRLAYEAADCGLLSADLAAGIRHVKGVKKLGVRVGNWLTAEQGQALWQAPDREQIKGKRDRALVVLLLACGLRRHEVAGLSVGHLQQREGHWAIVDLRGKGGHIRTIPVPVWVHGLFG
jgi:site-specific recombinase XerD